MQSPTRRSLDGLLAIGPHRLDAQLQALTAYAARTEHALDVLWALLPGEDPATDAPDSGFPIVAFDDEIAGFTPEEYQSSALADDSPGNTTTDWHVAHTTPQAKRPTTHLPVYGCAEDRETAADALLCVGPESLDRQIARIEAYAIRSAIRLRGVYVAIDPDNLQVLLRDFSASNKALGTGPTLTIGPRGEVKVHD
ncbi:hypothetical protein BH24GEM3_BH24GEM3_19680 [soil metagenome]